MAAATGGRLLAALGVAAALFAIWLNAIDTTGYSVSYWDLDGSLAGVMLGLAWLAGLAVAGALTTHRTALDLALGGVGCVLLGLYLYIPAGTAFAHWETVGRGAWLGVCSGLIVLGTGFALVRMARLTVAIEWVPLAVAVLGWAMVLAGIWLDADADGGSYFDPGSGQHGLGALLLILLGLWAVAAVAGVLDLRAAPLALAAAVGLVTLGLTLFVPASALFRGIGDLRSGTWLPLGGACLLSLGSALAIRRGG